MRDARLNLIPSAADFAQPPLTSSFSLFPSSYDLSIAAVDMVKAAKLIVWDFDGPIALTEKEQIAGWLNVLNPLIAKHSPKSLLLTAETFVAEMFGKKDTCIMKTYKERYELVDDIDVLVHLRNESYIQSALDNKIQMNAFAVSLLEDLRDTGHEPIIVSHGRTINIDKLLGFWGKHDCFAGVHTADTMNGMPKVDFLMDIARDRNLRPEDIVMLEDSFGTILAIEERGMHGIYVLHEHNETLHGTDEPFRPKSGHVIDLREKHIIRPDQYRLTLV